MLNFLLDNGISVDSLVRLNWPMYSSYEKMQTRLKMFTQAQLLPPPKPWVLTSNDVVFER